MTIKSRVCTIIGTLLATLFSVCFVGLFLGSYKYTIIFNYALLNIAVLMITVVASFLLFLSDRKITKIIFIIAAFFEMCMLVLLSVNGWILGVSVLLYTAGYLFSDKKKSLPMTAIICLILILPYGLISFLAYSLDGGETITTEEYVSHDGKYTVEVTTVEYFGNSPETENNVYYWKNDKICDFGIFELYPKGKALGTVSGNYADASCGWDGNNIFVIGVNRFVLEDY